MTTVPHSAWWRLTRASSMSWIWCCRSAWIVVCRLPPLTGSTVVRLPPGMIAPLGAVSNASSPGLPVRRSSNRDSSPDDPCPSALTVPMSGAATFPLG